MTTKTKDIALLTALFVATAIFIAGCKAASIPLALAPTPPPSPPTPSATALASMPKPAHIVIVIDENQDFTTIAGPGNSCPYLNSLANSGALMTSSYGCGHKSEDNYDSFFFGDPEDGYDDPCPNPVNGPSLGSELLQAGYSFCGYAENLPSAGSTVCSDPTGLYNIHHCPWIQGNTLMGGNMPVTCGQPFTFFPTDYSTLPTVSIVIPSEVDNMHSSTPAAGDSWLQANLSSYATWCQTLSNNSLLIITWDENANSSTDGEGTTVGNTSENQITTIFYGAKVHTGQYPELINHYNVLNTLLTMYHLSQIGGSVGVNPITDIF